MKGYTLLGASIAWLIAGTTLSASAATKPDIIKQCVVDNQGQKQTDATVSSYCSCMADKMPATETLSVTDWEQAHQPDQDDCATGANWKTD